MEDAVFDQIGTLLDLVSGKAGCDEDGVDRVEQVILLLKNNPPTADQMVSIQEQFCTTIRRIDPIKAKDTHRELTVAIENVLPTFRAQSNQSL
ncbi:MAG: hypothetical protein WAV51_00165 [Microgenomates group bacterium]